MDTKQIRKGVLAAYSSAADQPHKEHPFPVGRAFAESLGYDAHFLNTLPVNSVSSFTGVSNVSLFADIAEGDTVLDMGCGAGLDSMIAAGRVGERGKVIGIDFSASMVKSARKAASTLRIKNASFYHAEAEFLPLSESIIDVAMVNGIFNLNVFRKQIMEELFRVIKDGGSVFGAELILSDSLPPDIKNNETDWFA